MGDAVVDVHGFEPGDHVTFSVIDHKTFAEQDRAAEAGEIIAELIPS